MKVIRVLLVEDNPADVELVREALSVREFSHVIDTAKDFEEAERYLEGIAIATPCPDVMLLDLNLPKGSGLELLRVFRAQPDCQKVPVIIVSSSNAPKDREQAARLGASHYFRKPTDFDEFMTLGPLVESVLSDSASKLSRQ